jgi:hypothetical protein
MQRIFDKTDKGREEIATRTHRLAPRLRTLLLLVDGKQTTEQLLQKITGLDEQSVNELLDGGFIQEIVNTADSTTNDTTSESVALPDPTTDEPAIEDSDDVQFAVADGETKFQVIQRFYTETIRATLGLRGYNLQAKAEQAQSFEDLKALYAPYLAAALKAKGDIFADKLNRQLKQLFEMENDSSA